MNKCSDVDLFLAQKQQKTGCRPVFSFGYSRSFPFDSVTPKPSEHTAIHSHFPQYCLTNLTETKLSATLLTVSRRDRNCRTLSSWQSPPSRVTVFRNFFSKRCESMRAEGEKNDEGSKRTRRRNPPKLGTGRRLGPRSVSRVTPAMKISQGIRSFRKKLHCRGF